MLYLRNNLAEYEVAVAHYYMRRTAYVAALNRGQYVIEHYQRTPAMPDALLVVVGAYRALGMEDLAADTERVYRANFPGHVAQAESSIFDWWPFE